MNAQPQQLSTKSAIAHWSRVLYIFFAWLFVLCIIFQVFLAGLSIFDGGTWQSVHVAAGRVFNFVPLVLILLAIIARLPRLIIWLSVMLFVQYELQVAFIELAGHFGAPVIAAFHPVNAMIMFWITVVVARKAEQFKKS